MTAPTKVAPIRAWVFQGYEVELVFGAGGI
jgi:hypothetical protein